MPEPTKDATGDTLQSSASRLAEFVLELAKGNEGRPPREWLVPYEALMAAYEACAASNEWTELRQQDA